MFGQKNLQNKSWFFSLGALLVISVTINVLLAQKIFSLRNVIENLKFEGKLQIGENLPNIEGIDLENKEVSMSYSDSQFPTVIYVLSPTCGWCKKNTNNILFLAENKKNKYRFIALSTTSEELDKYVKSHNIPFQVFSASEKTMTAYKLGATPQTIIVSPNGEIVKNWTGAYTDNIKDEIESFFDVKLPGLVETQ